MREQSRTLELTEADLLGFAPGDLACRQCGGVFCGWRIGRIYEGKPLIMCSRKGEVESVLTSTKRHRGLPHADCR